MEMKVTNKVIGNPENSWRHRISWVFPDTERYATIHQQPMQMQNGTNKVKGKLTISIIKTRANTAEGSN